MDKNVLVARKQCISYRERHTTSTLTGLLDNSVLIIQIDIQSSH